MYLSLIFVFALAWSTQVQSNELYKVPPPQEDIVQCADTVWQQASMAFANYSGYSTSGKMPANQTGFKIWYTYQPLADYLVSVVSANPGSQAGFAKICNAWEIFWGSMGLTSTNVQFSGRDCMSAENLVTNKGVDPTTAFAIIGLANQYKFECGAGFYTLYRENLNCVQRVLANYASTLAGCLNTWQANVQHDSPHACDHMGNYTKCVAAVFNQSSCSYSNIDWWWGCEGALQFSLAQFPSCRHARSCTINRTPFGFGGFEKELYEYLEDHHKVDEQGVHWYKLPPIWKEISTNDWVLTEQDWITG